MSSGQKEPLPDSQQADVGGGLTELADVVQAELAGRETDAHFGDVESDESVAELEAEADFAFVDEAAAEIQVLPPGFLAGMSGSVVGEDGSPVEGLFVQPCTYTQDEETCYKSLTDESGHWSIAISPPKDVVATHVRLVTDLYAPLSCHYEKDQLQVEDGVAVFAKPLVAVAIPDESAVVVQAEPTEAVFLNVDGLSVTIQPDQFFPGVFETTTIRGMKFPLGEDLPCFLSPDTVPDELYVFTPDWMAFGPPGGIEVRFANSKGLAPETKVTLHVLGGGDTWIHPVAGDPFHLQVGLWYELGTGTVSPDGAEIVSDPGCGMPGLGWIGWEKG